MKLQELAVTRTSKQAGKVFESFFGQDISFIAGFDSSKANTMLKKVRGLIAEERRKPSFHSSEQNPAYLKLVVMEQALTSRIREQAIGGTPGGNAAQQGSTTPAKTPAQMTPQEKQAADAAAKAAAAKVTDPKLKAIVQKKMNGANLTPDEQTLAVNAAIETHESRVNRRLYNMLRESEVQQAAVVMASKKMVDEVQGMLEDVTSMQFKDLPALVDNIKYQVGVQQAQQFNTDASAALANLVESLQAAKQQLDQALSVVSGQESVIPGQDEMDADIGAEELPDLGDEEDIDVDLDVDADAGGDIGSDLGRERR